jgi:hypothetical protein
LEFQDLQIQFHDPNRPGQAGNFLIQLLGGAISEGALDTVLDGWNTAQDQTIGTPGP